MTITLVFSLDNKLQNILFVLTPPRLTHLLAFRDGLKGEKQVILARSSITDKGMKSSQLAQWTIYNNDNITMVEVTIMLIFSLLIYKI